MKKLYSVIAAALTFITAGTKLSDTADNDEAAAAVSSYCDENFYLNQMQATINSKLQPLSNKASELEGQQRNYRLAAAAATSAQEACLLLGLQSLAAATRNEILSELNKAKPIIDNANAAINKQKQIVLKAHTLAGLSITLDTASGPEQRGGSGNNIDIDIKNAVNSKQPCDMAANNANGKISEHTPNLQKLHTLKIETKEKLTANLQHDKVYLKANSGCNYNNPGKAAFLTAVANCMFNTGSGAISITSKAKRHADAVETVQLYTGDDPKNDCLEENKGADAASKPKRHFANAICQALKLSAPSIDMPNLEGPTLSTHPMIQRTVGNCLKEFSGLKDKTKSPDNAALVNFLKKAYGADNQAFKSKFRSLVDDKTVPMFRNGQETQTTIPTVNGEAEEQEVLARLEAERRAREDALASKMTQQGAESVAKRAKDCQDEKNENKCNKKDGCEFQDGMCKLKEGVKSENDGKTTNTTGSNTVFIKKAPLWLAVLIL
uniref:Variant surface glycoprotein 1125.4229 n=1 Tax=Trypanosoma brucei TaxID=5691 RepID=A0A1J0RAD8_9TRYP|nr:variant surface glycoprotein 1125.4229 [Trypanosoma brucei]